MRAEVAALEVEGLSHAYGARRALDGVSFSVAPGAFCALLGPNGAGKSTLFALLTRLFDHRGGSLRVFGTELLSDPGAALARIGVVFQQPTLDPDLTVRQNLMYHAALHGLPRREARARGDAELDRLGLLDRAGDRVRGLSGGQRRRAELARALVTRPSLLLLDEPTVGLDVPSREMILAHVRGLCAAGALAALWATHLLDEAEAADALVVLHGGTVRATGGPAGVMAATGTATLRAAYDALTPPLPPGGPPG